MHRPSEMKRNNCNLEITSRGDVIRINDVSSIVGKLNTVEKSTVSNGVENDFSVVFQITLYFDGKNFECSVDLGSYSICADQLAMFLVRKNVHNFDLIRSGQYLHGASRIHVDDVIHVSGGFDKYLVSSWNKIMHALNGNIDTVRKEECLENNGHKPNDKFGQKRRQDNVSKAVKLNKEKGVFRKMADTTYKNGRPIFEKRNYVPKVTAEDDNVVPGAIDVGAPTITAEPVKKDKPDLVTSLDFTESLGSQYEIDYVINGESPPDYVWRRNLVFGFIPRFTFVEIRKDHWLRYVPIFLYFFIFILNLVCPELHTIPIFKIFSFQRFIDRASEIDFNGGHCEFFQSKMSGVFWVWKEFTSPVLISICYWFRDMSAFYLVNYPFVYHLSKYLIRNLLLISTLGFAAKRATYYLSWICYYPRYIYPVQAFYTRKSTLTEVITRKRDKTMDFRVQGQKTFEMTEDSTLGVFDEEYTKTYPYGYYEDGRFITIDKYVHDRKVTTSTCELELVCQMFSSRNTCSTVSSEALVERIASSTNLAPHVNNFRNDPFMHDVYNNSSRLAALIVLHHRYAHSKSLDHQLFWQGNALGLMQTREY